MLLRPRAFISAALLGLSLHAIGCGDTPPPTVSLTLTPNRIASGGTTRADVTVTDFELLHENTAHTHTLASAHEAGDETGAEDIVRSGHYHLYLDSLETNPIAMETEPSVELTVTASVGAHKIIARLHGEDHKIIEPQITAEADLTIE